MSVEQILSIGFISLFITLIGIAYKVGKWQQKKDNDKQEINKKLDEISAKIDKVPDEFLPLFIDLYKMYEKMGENPRITNKERQQNEK